MQRMGNLLEYYLALCRSPIIALLDISATRSNSQQSVTWGPSEENISPDIAPSLSQRIDCTFSRPISLPPLEPSPPANAPVRLIADNINIYILLHFGVHFQRFLRYRMKGIKNISSVKSSLLPLRQRTKNIISLTDMGMLGRSRCVHIFFLKVSNSSIITVTKGWLHGCSPGTASTPAPLPKGGTYTRYNKTVKNAAFVRHHRRGRVFLHSRILQRVVVHAIPHAGNS